MPTVSPTPITPRDERVVTAHEALEPLYERLALHTESTLLSAAMAAGWPAEEATRALAALRLQDALSILCRASGGARISMHSPTAE
ncbi:hypothetical protein [Rhizobium leguminosarum]|uniref:hypothetical protein n=1 Tax=Rhizobium TaxID=379 RepID=UPI001030B9EE|nr:hypothetical protein [Rhizobium leguminosarum]TAU72665.1 hypothetical protein ELI40_31940 [Rhizobium leguminosarum]TAU80987.1 hypothetical protein ELI41_25970 [Rhizobium leguminosarum]TAV46469.1 hypothetical protein ELI29_26520 [Rhizobium leguminosarum]TAX11940.1 hypothetical protein ELI07_21655 [Rhizobium leguminosarum]TAY07633.1 hypothetical protein ELH96_28905 [Rhizobium leguminosarum]